MKTLVQFASTALLAGAVAVAGLNAVASPPTAARPDLSRLEPFLDRYTVLVVQFDLEHVDLAAAATALVDQFPEFREVVAGPVQELQAQWEPWIRDFRQAGGRQLFLLFRLGWPLPITAVVPLEPGADPAALKQTLAAHLDWPGDVRHGCFVSAPAAELDPARPLIPPHRAESWQALFNTAPPGLVRVALLPYPESTRVLEDLLPILPGILGGGPGQTLARGFQSATLAFELPPRGALTLDIQATSNEGAFALHQIIDHALKSLAHQPDVQRLMPMWADFAPLLVPTTDGNRLRLRLEVAQVAELARQLQPPLEEARTRAAFIVKMNKVKQICLGLILYASEHGDRLPTHLADTLRYLGDPRVLLDVNDSRTPPANLIDQPRDARVAWVDQHSAFVLVRSGVLLKEIPSPATTVMIHERLPDDDEAHAAIGFFDGHAEVRRAADLRRLLAEQAVPPGP